MTYTEKEFFMITKTVGKQDYCSNENWHYCHQVCSYTSLYKSPSLNSADIDSTLASITDFLCILVI